MKRFIDCIAALFGIIALAPILAMIAIAVRLTSPGPIIFRQLRMGKNFQAFEILKFRTMVQDAPKLGGQITVGKDPRITWIGHLLRRTKLDELPQIFNVFKGEMSLVGPRPEVPKYVELFRDDYEIILQVRPGLSDLASLEFRDESSMLDRAEDPEKEYIDKILPEKIRLAKEYIERRSQWFDLVIVVKTVWYLVADRVGLVSKNA